MNDWEKKLMKKIVIGFVLAAAFSALAAFTINQQIEQVNKDCPKGLFFCLGKSVKSFQDGLK